VAIETRQFPKVKIIGGPHGKDTVMEIDGVRVAKTTRVEVVFDVNDIVRLKTFQYVEAIVEAEIPEGTTTHVWTARVNQMVPDGLVQTWERLAEATADSDWQALMDCAKQLEMRAKSST
jgi:hypothetical protein